MDRTLRCLKKGSITIGFLGGSITDGRPRCNWPEPVTRWFIETYPGLRVASENAAIGATNSTLAVFRTQRDIIDRNCDLVFVEYAVNDSGLPENQRNCAREGVIRKLLRANIDVILVYTYFQPMYEDMKAGKVPATIAGFEKLAERYKLNSVWMGLQAWQEIQRGRMNWKEFLHDGLHPGPLGSLSYSRAVISLLQDVLCDAQQSFKGSHPEDAADPDPTLPAPLYPLNWEKASTFSFTDVNLIGPWEIRRCTTLAWIDQTLETAAVGLGATLLLNFHGRGIALGFDYGKKSATFQYRLDQGDWNRESTEKPPWAPDADGWFRCIVLRDDLSDGEHTIEIEPLHGDMGNALSSTFRLGLIGIIR